VEEEGNENKMQHVGVLPYRHILLPEIREQQVNDKVRFLCCSVEYEESTGTLMVEHVSRRSDTRCRSVATVDVNMVVTSLPGNMLRRGTWLNVIGYVLGGEIEENERDGVES